MARVGAQARDEALHTDRCVAQYGLLMKPNGQRGDGGKRVRSGRLGRDRPEGRVFELGVSVRGRARMQRAVDFAANRNRLVTAAQTTAVAPGHAIAALRPALLAHGRPSPLAAVLGRALR